MTPLRIFISSVQTEFAQERAALRDYLRGDPLMRRFFEVFLFEEVPASDHRPDALYLDEVERCELYVGLFGNEYGTEDEEDGLIRKRFNTSEELVAGIYASLVEYLEVKELIRWGPFDAAACP